MIERVKLTVLAEDSLSESRQGLIAKHGLSLLIQGEADGNKFSLLMDTGPSPDIVLHNAEIMGIDLSRIDIIFLSHGHYDHTGGLVGILKHIKKRAPVIAHPQVFDAKLKIGPTLKYIGAPFKPADVEASGGVMLFARNPVTMAKGVMTSGEIERSTPFEKVEEFWTVDGEKFKEDIMLDDQALTINVKERGLMILSGCAHSGIINTIRQAQKVTDASKIYAILGGFHLKNADAKRIESTIKELKKITPEVIRPCHCTESKAVHQLAQAFGGHCKLLRTGDTIEL